MSRPKLAAEKALRTHISYRPDQAAKVRQLQAEKRLSAICQAAIDQVMI